MMRLIAIILWLVPCAALAQQAPPYPAYSGNVNGEGTLWTYSTNTLGIVPASSATDVFCISGSATRTIRVSSFRISGTAQANIVIDVVIIRRSSLNTGGTPTVDIGVTHDTNDPAATAVVTSYAANPTLGTAVGDMRGQKITLSTASGPNVNIVPVVLSFANLDGKVGVLRGVNQALCVNLNGQTISSGNLDIDVQWTEN